MQEDKKQNKVFAVGFLLIIVVILAFLLRPLISNWQSRKDNLNEHKANEEILKAPSIASSDLYQKIQGKSKIFLVDISPNVDFERGHIATSINFPAEKIDKNFFVGIGADSVSDIVIVNQGSDLVFLAATVNRVISSGFPNAKYLRGGIADWREKGLPLVSSGISENDSAKVKKITIPEIRNEAEKNPKVLQFLDTRDKNAYSLEHIVGAVNIPPAEIELRQNELPVLKKIIIYGSGENESFQAAVKLFDLNYFNAYQMQGTIEDWKEAGGNVEH